MSRPLRIEYPGAWHHVMNRGRRREDVFLQSDDYHAFLKIVREAAEVWNLKVAAYCLMSNHYHLLVQTPDANLARCMRHINGVYTQYFNRTHHQDGPLFRGRYKSVLVEEDSHLLEVMRYIHRNPLNAGLARRLDEYPWSSHHGYVSSGEQWGWLARDSLLTMLSSKRAQREKLYLDFVSQGEPDEITAFYGMKKLSSMLGGESFREWVRNRFSHLDQQEVADARGLATPPEQIAALVCDYFDLDGIELKKSRRGVENRPRDIAVYLSRCYSRKTLAEIGLTFGISNDSTVSSAVERIKSRKDDDSGLRRALDDLAGMIAKSNGRLAPPGFSTEPDSRSKHLGLSNLSKNSDDVATYYDNWASDYNETLADWRYEAPLQVAAMLRTKLSLDSTILDAGCGTGLSGKAFLSAGFTTIDGIDVSHRSLEIAGKSCAYRALHEMDLQRLPLLIPDGHYDGLACVGVLTYLPDSVATLREFNRVVRSGGVVVVTQRSDLFVERAFQNVLEGLLRDGDIAQLSISEPRPYLPDNEEFGDRILVHYVSYTVV